MLGVENGVSFTHHPRSLFGPRYPRVKCLRIPVKSPTLFEQARDARADEVGEGVSPILGIAGGNASRGLKRAASL